MEITIRGRQEFVLRHFVGGPCSRAPSERFAIVKERCKQLIAPAMINGAAAVTGHAGHRDMAERVCRAEQSPLILISCEHFFAMRIGSAVEPMHQAIDSRAGVKNLTVPSMSPESVKSTSTGLSMPPPQWIAWSAPSGRQENM